MTTWEPMLTTQQLVDELTRITYRPGWVFTVHTDVHEGPTLRIVASVQDGYNPDATIDLGIDARIPDIITTPDLFHRWLLWRVLEVESHECREYLRIDGHLYRDPHQALTS